MTPTEALARAEFALSLAVNATVEDRSWLDEAVAALAELHSLAADGWTLARTEERGDAWRQGVIEGINGAIAIVTQSLDTVRSEDDGENRVVRLSIAAREHIIRLLTGYREYWKTQVGGDATDLPAIARTDDARGVSLIAAERRRQVKEEGYDADHDRSVAGGEHSLTRAAVAYAIASLSTLTHDTWGEAQRWWPWPDEAWKPRGARVDRVRAAALLAAALDLMGDDARTRDAAREALP